MNDNEQTPGPTPGTVRAAPLSWMESFLAALAETGNIRHSARTAGIAQTTAYDARQRHPAFASAWKTAVTGKEYDPRNSAPACPVAAPVPEPEQPATRPANWKASFLEALAETSSLADSAKRAGVPVRKVYKLRRDDADFATRWLAALHEGYDNLEMELLGYLRDPQPRRKMDVTAALRLLSSHRDTVERRRALIEEEDEQAILDSIDQFIDEMCERRAANTAILGEAGADDGAD